jgi:hypothetical protein
VLFTPGSTEVVGGEIGGLGTMGDETGDGEVVSSRDGVTDGVSMVCCGAGDGSGTTEGAGDGDGLGTGCGDSYRQGAEKSNGGMVRVANICV